MYDVAYLEAYVAISHVKAKYCRTLDTKDWEGFGSVFTDDIELDTRPAGGMVTNGREQYLAMVKYSLDSATTAHQVHSPEMKINGDSADVIWAMQDRVIWGADRVAEIGSYGLTGYGQYHEHYVRKNGEWRIARQMLSRFHVDIDHEPVTLFMRPAG